MKKQKLLFESGNELAAYAARQINYHVMGYYPITPSTQIAEFLDQMKAQGEHDISMIPAEGEHSAAGICYGAAAAGGRVFGATSANGLLYALEQLPVQSGTRFPMVMNVACRTVSGPLDIKGDHSDIMYALNTGWMILFAGTPQAVYDMNLCALKIAESVSLPVIVAFDGFFTSHQKRGCRVFEKDEDVREFVGEYRPGHTVLDLENPVSIGSYMNEPDLINNKYQLHLAMEKAREVIAQIFSEYRELSGRSYQAAEGYRWEDAETLLLLLGSSYHTAKEAVDILRQKGEKVGAITVNTLRPFPFEELSKLCQNARVIIAGDRQDSYGAGGGCLSLELRAALQRAGLTPRVLSRVYGLGGRDFYIEDALEFFKAAQNSTSPLFDYYGVYPGEESSQTKQFFAPIGAKESSPGITFCREADGKLQVTGGQVSASTAMPRRLAPGHGACPGCGIPVNVNLLLKGMEGNVVLLFQTGCGMVVTTPYPQTSFRVPYLHNLFQNGAATLSGVVETFRQRQKRGEYPQGEITFVMVSGDGGMDIGMGSALGAVLRGSSMVLLEYDNGGYMNTGYQLSYSTPKGAKSSTSHVGPFQYGKGFFHKDMPALMSAAGAAYVATAAESNPSDFIKKAAKAQYYSLHGGFSYLRALSACPLNWGSRPNQGRSIVAAGVDCCYFPLYEVEKGITSLSYDPEEHQKKIPVLQWMELMGRTRHLSGETYRETVESVQREVDRRWARLRAQAENDLL